MSVYCFFGEANFVLCGGQGGRDGQGGSTTRYTK